MEKVFLTILTTLFLLSPSSAIAISAPNLLSPENLSTTSSNTLSWETVTDATQYKVIVDDEETISSPYIKGPYYTTNTRYSPTLSEGTYFWKVAAKDNSGSWSEWSPIWSFSLSGSSETPSPTNIPPSSTPYSTPNQPTDPTPTTSKSSFIISGIPSTIDSDQSFPVSVELLLPNSPSTTFFLKAAFKKADSSNYFGYTKVGSSWIKNSSSYSSQYKITTDSAGSWSGQLDVKPDAADSGFTGTSDYLLKIGRYSSSGSGPTWSNEQSLKIIGVATETESDKTSETAYTTPPTGNVSSKSLVKTSKTKTNVAGITFEATPSSNAAAQKAIETEVKENNTFNYIPFVGGLLILSGATLSVYILYKEKLKSKL